MALCTKSFESSLFFVVKVWFIAIAVIYWPSLSKRNWKLKLDIMQQISNFGKIKVKVFSCKLY